MRDRKKLLIIIALATVGAAIIIALAAISFSSCSKTRRFEGLMDDARYLYESGDYEGCVRALEEAAQLDSLPEIYLLFADAYYVGLGDIDSAIEWLYVGSYRHLDDEIEARLAELKKLKAEEDGASFIEIGGEKVDILAKTLILSGRRLTDISRIAELVALESLTLSDNGITDASPIAGLTKLTYLNLSNNSLKDITPLGLLPNLRTLYIDGNPIEDFSPLYRLRELRSLSIKGIKITEEQLESLKEALPDCSINHDDPEDAAKELTLGGVTFMSDVEELSLQSKGIVDISVLEECESLKRLDLRDNAVADLSPLEGLINLEWIDLTNNRIVDIAPLGKLPKIAYLALDANRITSVAALSASFSLEELWLSYNNFRDAGPLRGLHSLRRLGLRGLSLEDKDIEELKPITSLRELALDENPTLTMNALDEIKAALVGCVISHSDALYTIKLGETEFRSDVTEISAANAGVTDIAGLEHFKKLQILMLPGNSITSIAQLSELLELRTLDLGNNTGGNNYITDLSPLSPLHNLRQLGLMRVSVSDISPLAGLTGLEELHLSYNPISSLTPLSNLTNLRSLTLAYSGIADISALGGLMNLAELDLEGNNITDFTPLYGLTSLRVLYIGSNDADEELVETLRSRLPDCVIYP